MKGLILDLGSKRTSWVVMTSRWKSKQLKPRSQPNERRVSLGGSRVETRACFSFKGNNHDFTKEGFLKCPARDKICPKCGIKGHYKDTERCNNPRAAYRCVKQSRTQRNEKC